MTDPFGVYRDTYHDQSVTDRAGRVLGHDQQDQQDHLEVESPEPVIMEPIPEVVPPKPRPRMIT